MSISVVTPSVHAAGTRAGTSRLDIGIAVGCAQDVAVTVRGVIGPDAAATVAELARALAATGALTVIVDLEGSVRPGGDVTRMLVPVGALLRARGGRLLISGDSELVTSASPVAADLEDAFSAYLEATTATS